MSTRKRKRPAQEGKAATKTVSVRRSIAGDVRSDESETMPIEILPFESDPAYVRVANGVTKNLGDFESLRLEVAITYPCYPERVEETYEQVSELTYDLVNTELDKWLGEEDGAETD